MKRNRFLTVLVTAVFSVAFVAADLCRCADALAAHSDGAEMAHPSGSHPCGDTAAPSVPCPGHAFHAVSGNDTPIASDSARVLSSSLPFVGTATVVPTSVPMLRPSPDRAQSNPLRAARSIPILNATFLL